MELRTLQFIAPSGHSFTIREQNGEDENILSNPLDVKTLMNLTKFISAIVVNTDFTKSGKLSVNDTLELPLLDRYCILLQSRIFSLGETLDIAYEWPKVGTVEYTEDLTNYLFEDYTKTPSQEEFDIKPHAVPYYAMGNQLKDIEVILASGKKVMFDIMNGNGEQYIINLPESKQTRNNELIARNLRLEVNGVFEKVSNFSGFSVKEMAELRKVVKAYDPVFDGLTELQNPSTGEVIMYPIMVSPTFFFLTEA